MNTLADLVGQSLMLSFDGPDPSDEILEALALALHGPLLEHRQEQKP